VLVIATPADADALLPPLVVTTQGEQTADLLFDNLATLRDSLVTIGDAGFAPQLARRWTWAPEGGGSRTLGSRLEQLNAEDAEERRGLLAQAFLCVPLRSLRSMLFERR